MVFKIFAVSVFASFIFGVQCEEFKKRFVLPRHGYRLMHDLHYQEDESPTLMACASICSHLSLCLAVSFKHSSNRCLLSSIPVADDGMANGCLVAEENWTTISKAVYTVYLRMHPDGNLLKYDEAVALCNERNTVVASEADLMTSRDLGLGFGVCICGWLSNQRNGFVVQEGNTFCSHEVSLTVRYCDWARADVWCRL